MLGIAELTKKKQDTANTCKKLKINKPKTLFPLIFAAPKTSLLGVYYGYKVYQRNIFVLV